MAKAALAARIWTTYAAVAVALRRAPLSRVASVAPRAPRLDGIEPERLGRIVNRALRLRSRMPRCLLRALVLHRLLRRRGVPAHLVIGLPHAPEEHAAHAWVEVEGRDVGPPPGRADHRELARYG